MENESAAIEDDGIDFFGQQFLGDRFADALSRLTIGCNFFSGQTLLSGRSRSQSPACVIVNDLRIDVSSREMHG